MWLRRLWNVDNNDVTVMEMCNPNYFANSLLCSTILWLCFALSIQRALLALPKQVNWITVNNTLTKVSRIYISNVILWLCTVLQCTKGKINKYGLYLQCCFFTGCPFLVATGHKSCCCECTRVFHAIHMAVIKIGLFSTSLGLCNMRGNMSMVMHLAGG